MESTSNLRTSLKEKALLSGFCRYQDLEIKHDIKLTDPWKENTSNFIRNQFRQRESNRNAWNIAKVLTGWNKSVSPLFETYLHDFYSINVFYF